MTEGVRRAEILYTLPRVSLRDTGKADRSCRLPLRMAIYPSKKAQRIESAARILFGHTQQKLPVKPQSPASSHSAPSERLSYHSTPPQGCQAFFLGKVSIFSVFSGVSSVTMRNFILFSESSHFSRSAVRFSPGFVRFSSGPVQVSEKAERRRVFARAGTNFLLKAARFHGIMEIPEGERRPSNPQIRFHRFAHAKGGRHDGTARR